MRNLFLFLSLVGFNAYGVEPLTLEQFKAQEDFEVASKEEGWTFKYDVRNIGKFKTGLKKAIGNAQPQSLGVGEKLKSWNISQFPHFVTPILNQGNCGSCVVFSFTANFMEALRLRRMDIPELSPQHLMNCGTGGQCNGAYGEEIAGDLVKLGSLHTEQDYPYTASSGKCKKKPGPRFGQIESYLTIDGSARSMLAALHAGQPVSVGIAADSRWSSYSSGVYNGCGSMSTNHYVVVEGIDCEGAVDADGYCKFDAEGSLPAGVGIATVRNSWGKGYGESGRIRMRLTNKNGAPCNNLAGDEGNAQVLNIGLPMPPLEPVKFDLVSPRAKISAVVQPEAKFTVDAAKKTLLTAIGG